MYCECSQFWPIWGRDPQLDLMKVAGWIFFYWFLLSAVLFLISVVVFLFFSFCTFFCRHGPYGLHTTFNKLGIISVFRFRCRR